jgi:hypothetical protein
VVEESSALPPPVAATAIEEGQMAVETGVSQAASEPPAGASPGSVVVVFVPSDEDSAPPLPSGDHDVVMTSVPVRSQAAEVPEPSPAAEVLEPSLAAGAAETSLAAGIVTVEEVMELVTGRYIDFPGVRIVDLDPSELPSNDREMLEVATEWMLSEPSILETIASVSLAPCQYESAGSFAPPNASEAAEAVPEESATNTESIAVVSAPPPTSEGQEVSLPQPAEAAESRSAAATAGAMEDVVGDVGSSSPRLVAAGADEVLASDEPAAALQVRVAPEDTTRAASPEIQEAEEGAGAALLQGATSGEAQTLEPACTSWAATSKSGDDAEDDEEVVARNTLERGLN